jgi:hypothetical protein
MYRVSRKNCENSVAARRRPATFAPARVRSRKIRSGSRGVFRAQLDHHERCDRGD